MAVAQVAEGTAPAEAAIDTDEDGVVDYCDPEAPEFEFDEGIADCPLLFEEVDEDEDGEVRTSAVGIPREGVGVSNNYLRGMRRPSFARSLFAHEGDTVVTIRGGMGRLA